MVREQAVASSNVLASGLLFPEGPVALPDGSIVIVEIFRGTVTRINPDGKTAVVATVGGGPNGAALGPDGRLYVCNNGGLALGGAYRGAIQPEDYVGGSVQRVDLDTGKVDVVYDSCDGHRLRGPNDIVFDRAGGFYFSDMGKQRGRDRDHGGLYYALPDGSRIAEIAYPLITPNGVGLSPAEDTLYFSETETGRVWAFGIERPGVLKKLAPPSINGAQLIGSRTGLHRYDSLAIEAGGNVCVGNIFGDSIDIFSPEGRLTRAVPTPDRRPTNICFGGPDMRTAFITLAGPGQLIAMKWDSPGLSLNWNPLT